MNDNRTKIATQPRNTSFKEYKKIKRQMIRDFCITLTDEENKRFNSLTTEIEVDNFCISMINKYL